MNEHDLAWAAMTCRWQQVEPRANSCAKFGCPEAIHCLPGLSGNAVCAVNVLAEMKSRKRREDEQAIEDYQKACAVQLSLSGRGV